jgi:hypothetical protein
MEGKEQRIPRPYRRQVVRGEPYNVAGRSLTPLARLVSYARGRGTLHQDRLSGWALGLVRVMPLGMLVETNAREEWIPVHDATAPALHRMALAAAGITLFLAGMRYLARRHRQPTS